MTPISAPALPKSPPSSRSLETLAEELLVLVGEDTQRQGLVRTPQRVAKAWQDLTSGYGVNVDQLINRALFDETYSEMVVVRDISFYSLCEHHLLPFFGVCHVAYMPNGKIIGLSKIPKLVKAFSRRLQVQERLTNEIADILMRKVGPLGVGVVMEARHMCMEMRGAESIDSPTVTSSMVGLFRTDGRTRDEFLALIHPK
jgi:GTP cyclohydrolase I